MRAAMLDRVQTAPRIARAKHLAHHRSQTLRPLGLPLRAEDQILAELDQRVGQPAAGAVAVKRIALELAAIGLVVADADPRQGSKPLEQGAGEPCILVPQDGDLPTPPHPPPRL